MISKKTSPMNFFETQQSLIDEGFRNLRRFARLPKLWQQAQELTKGASPSEVAYSENQVRLLHYLSEQPPKYATPLIFVFALVNRPYILDLKKGKSVVE